MDEDVEAVVGLAPAREDALDVLVGLDVAGLDEGRARWTSARGRTRLSIRLSIDEKPTSAPSAWRAWAMPQAIEWSFATPKISAFLPSSSPIRRPLRCIAAPMRPSARLTIATQARPAPDPAPRPAGVRALLLDLDGVIVVAGGAVPGAPEAIGDARGARRSRTGS